MQQQFRRFGGLLQSACAGGLVVGSSLPSYEQSRWRQRTCACAVELPAEARWTPFRSEYRGHLTPKRSATVASNSAPVEVQWGPFKALWVRVNAHAKVSEVVGAVGSVRGSTPTAVYVGIPDEYGDCGSLVARLRSEGFKFHHYVSGDGRVGVPTGEFLYYKWVGVGHDMVPAYSTALEGVGVMIFSPERDAILLVWEYGQWKMITGHIDLCENMVTCVHREVREEVGLELVGSMRMIGGWQHAKFHDNLVSNVFCVFSGTARSRDFKVDGHEIHEARWFPISSFPTVEDEQAAEPDHETFSSMKWDLGIPGRERLSRAVVHFLKVELSGRGLNVTARAGAECGLFAGRNFFH